MRSLCLALAVLVACKEKQEAKPTAPPPAPAAKPEAAPAPSPPPPTTTPAATEAQEPAPAAPAIEPAGGFTTAAEYEAKALDLLDQLTQVFVRAGTNCEKLADGIELFLADHEAEFASTNAFEAANPTAEGDLQAKMRDKAKVFMTKASASMQACQKHERVQAALARLPD